MKDLFKHQWKENIKTAFMIMLIGALMIIGMRLAEIAWPETQRKVLICFADDIGKVEDCKPFEK